VSIPNLHGIQTVDSTKLANKLNTACTKVGRSEPLRVMVQVNTSQEASKSGVSVENCAPLARHILTSCPNLLFDGLMTIGSFVKPPIDDDFKVLKSCRTSVCEELKLDENQIGLSMGMSHDYLLAIENGATSVRVGSSIFGARSYAPGKEPQPKTAEPTTSSTTTQ